MSINKKYALISVSDKSNVEELANFLTSNNFKIISTGGTYKKLKELKIEVVSISEITNFPEIMDGRVKTLHPNVHAGLLARKCDDQILSELNIKRIDVLVVNFYPFENTINKPNVRFENAIENIDIGGPAMVRAAAKNYLNCTVLTNPNDYNYFINNYNTQKISNEGINKKMSLRAFQYVAHYDICIANYLEKEIEGENFPKFHTFKKISNLRYGENPHQKASLFQNYNEREVSIVNSKTLQGKELSFNNIVDGDTALSCVINFEKPSCVIVKHANPCGVSSDNNLQDAYKNAYLTDSVSAFGGVIAFNSEVNEELMKSILDNQFVELIIAPLFSSDSLEYAKTKKNVRIIEYVDYKKTDFNNAKQIKNISDGILMQDLDHSKEDKIEKYKVVSERLPTQKELDDLGFAWVVAKYVKSNAIVFAKNKKTLGVGAGQMSRIDSTFIASKKAEQENLSLDNAVMASDAFFPFPDNVEKAAELGIKAIIQPGGSKNDQEVIDKANELNLSLVFTGIRHFRH